MIRCRGIVYDDKAKNAILFDLDKLDTEDCFLLGTMEDPKEYLRSHLSEASYFATYTREFYDEDDAVEFFKAAYIDRN